MKNNGYFIPKPTSCHVDWNCKTMMPCGMLMSFAIIQWFMWLSHYRCSQKIQQSFLVPIENDRMCGSDESQTF